MTELYNKEILRWATRQPLMRSLDTPDAAVTKTSRICGSRLTVAVTFQNGVIKEYAHDVKACALGQACAAIMASKAVGLDQSRFEDVAARFYRMLDTGIADFPPEWEALSLLAPVHEYTARRGSVMLPFDCLEALFSDGAHASHSLPVDAQA